MFLMIFLNFTTIFRFGLISVRYDGTAYSLPRNFSKPIHATGFVFVVSLHKTILFHHYQPTVCAFLPQNLSTSTNILFSASCKLLANGEQFRYDDPNSANVRILRMFCSENPLSPGNSFLNCWLIREIAPVPHVPFREFAAT